MLRRVGALAVVWALAVASAAAVVPGQASPGTAAPTAAEVEAGQIAGTVFSSTGSALEGARVTLTSGSYGYRSVVTDAAGRWAIASVEPGSHRLYVSGADVGHETTRLDGTPYFSGVTSLGTDTNVIVEPGATTDGVDAVVQPSGTITGTVAPYGTPARAWPVVDVYRQVGTTGSWTRVVRHRLGEVSGSYAVGGLPPGDYKVGFSLARNDLYRADTEPDFVYAGGALDLADSPVVHLDPGGTARGVDAAPQLGGHIVGTVVTSSGHPVSCSVVLRQWDAPTSTWAVVESGLSEEDGSFEFRWLPAAAFRLSFGYGTDSCGPPAQDLPGVVQATGTTTVDMVLRDAGSMRGAVVDEDTGEPVAGVWVTPLVQQGGCPGWTSTYHSSYSDADGRWSHPGLSGVRLRFVADGYATEYNGGATEVAAAETLVRSTFDDLVVDAALGRGGSIEGVLADDVTGDPRAGVGVRALRLVQGVTGTCWQQEDRVVSGADGSFTFPHLPGGSYLLEYAVPDRGVFYSGGVMGQSGAVRLAVADGRTTVRDDTLPGRFGSLSGRILAERTPWVDFRFKAVLYELVDGSWRRGWERLVPDDFQIDNVPEGTYRVRFEYPYDYFVPEFWHDATTVDEAEDVVVVGDATTGGIEPHVSINPYAYIDNTTLPVLTGQSQVGKTLSVTPGTWNRDDLTFSYRWYDRAAQAFVPGATDSTFTLTDAQLGRSLEAVVTAAGPGRDPVTEWSSELVGPIGAAPRPPFSASTRPTVAGEPRVGSVLRVSPGSWSPAGARFGYQWLADGAPVPGANAPTLVLTADHQGARITARVLAWGPPGSPATSTTGVTAPVLAAPPAVAPPPSTTPAVVEVALASTGRPHVVGKARVGRMLRVRGATWTRDDARVRYRWFADGVRVDQAHGARLELTRRMRGKRIVAWVTARVAGQAAVTVRTRRTPPVRP